MKGPSHALRAIVALIVLTITFAATALSQSEQKPNYAILVDNTGSLRTQFPYVIALSKSIVQRTHQQGPVSLFNFKPYRDLRQPVATVTAGPQSIQSIAALEGYLDGLFVIGGQTTLRDAIDFMAQQMNDNAQQLAGEKIIILVTDGEDRVSKINEDDLLKSLKTSGIKVYAVGLTTELDDPSRGLNESKRSKAEHFLKKLTKETDGRVVFASSKNDIDDVVDHLLAK